MTEYIPPYLQFHTADNLTHTNPYSPRCDECGRFSTRLEQVWGPLPSSGPDHEACEQCRPNLFTGPAWK